VRFLPESSWTLKPGTSETCARDRTVAAAVMGRILPEVYDAQVSYRTFCSWMRTCLRRSDSKRRFHTLRRETESANRSEELRSVRECMPHSHELLHGRMWSYTVGLIRGVQKRGQSQRRGAATPWLLDRLRMQRQRDRGQSLPQNVG